MANFVTKLWNTPHTVYHIPSIPIVSWSTVLYSLLAGIAFGLCASLFIKSMHFFTKQFKIVIPFPPLRPFVWGILIALAVYTIGTTKYIGLGIPTIVLSFNEQLPAYDFALKIVFTIVTLSAGFKGGEVTPLFFIGALLGNALSYFIPLPMGLLAGMGFVAVFAGATNTPLACTIMAIELFGGHAVIYIAIACIVAYFVAGKNSIYTIHHC